MTRTSDALEITNSNLIGCFCAIGLRD